MSRPVYSSRVHQRYARTQRSRGGQRIEALLQVSLAALLFSACATAGDTADDTTVAAGSMPEGAHAMSLATATGMNGPESAVYDDGLRSFYVSNVVGGGSDKDNNGYIVVVPTDSISTHVKLIAGGVAGVTLHAPKGMAIMADTLWVADIDVVRGFDKTSGASVANISLVEQGATFLNDVAVGPDGDLHVTDSGIRFDSTGAMLPTGTSRIFRISGRDVSVVASGDALAHPNGLTWDAAGGRWIIAPLGSDAVLTLTPGSAEPGTLISGPGGYDGVIALENGTILVTSWADSAVHMIRNGTMSVLVSGVASPADIGFSATRMMLAVPQLNENRVVFYHIMGM